MISRRDFLEKTAALTALGVTTQHTTLGPKVHSTVYTDTQEFSLCGQWDFTFDPQLGLKQFWFATDYALVAWGTTCSICTVNFRVLRFVPIGSS